MKRRTTFAIGGFALFQVAFALFQLSSRARKKTAPKPLPSSSTPPTPVALTRIGGALRRGQGYFAELLVFNDGRVEAALSDPEGHALNEPAEVSIELATRGAATVTLPLRYFPKRERFLGRASHDLEVASGPATLRIAHNGRADVIAIDRVSVLFGPQRGGHMFSLGDLGVELIPEATGRVRAFVHDALGAPVLDPKLSLEAVLLSQSLEKQRVALRLDPQSASYVGNAAAALRPGPIELAANSARSRIEQAGLLPAAQHGGQVLLVGFHSVELLLPQNEAQVFVYDAFAKPYPAGHLELMVVFKGPNAGFYRLSWDEKTFSYRAELRGRDVSAVMVSLTAGARTDLGGAALR
jgi:hypothetical protein